VSGTALFSAVAGLILAGLARLALSRGGGAAFPPAVLAGLCLLLAMVEAARREGRWARLATPALFGLLLLWLWEMAVIGFSIPFVLLPPPSAVLRALIVQAGVLAADFEQTYLHAVLAGYAAGCAGGFLAALALDRFPFLQRGVLPFGNMMSAMPIVGIAPIMVIWFGFDWPSKAAVVVVMTFFPMLVNTTAGLAEAGALERDLMRSYAASYRTTLFKLRLPAALPHIFTALKLNAPLALIGAVVAEFFGTPIVGMGFRISTEAARMNLDLVWATITVAALAGSLSFGALALLERAVTFWHPAWRGTSREEQAGKRGMTP
jgi:NitT/TauT family transport system permease protein